VSSSEHSRGGLFGVDCFHQDQALDALQVE
jgi:hypothetical protein